MVIHGAADGKIPLTKEMQDKFVKYGLMPAIPEGGIGAPAWPFASIAKNLSDVASIDMGEQLLTEHKDDITRFSTTLVQAEQTAREGNVDGCTRPRRFGRRKSTI